MARPIEIARHPILSLLLPIPVICFIGALLTDLSYANSGGNFMWINFSSWLIASGLAFGAVVLVILAIDALRGSSGWLAFLLIAAAWIVEFLNALIHARDGWTAVVPIGMTLSAIGAALIVIGGWLSRSTHVVGGVR